MCGVSFALRVGIHLGKVVGGVFGSNSLQFDIVGDTVNLASRLESSSQRDTIHCSENFLRSLDGNARAANFHKVTPPLYLKGINRDVSTFMWEPAEAAVGGK